MSGQERGRAPGDGPEPEPRFSGLATVERIVGLCRRTFLLNFGVVEPGVVYRCARPGKRLPALVETFALASVLDFERGFLARDLGADSWGNAQIRAAGERSIDYYQFPMPFTRRPLREELLALVTFLERCRYPLLIYCETGADRTGLAVGLYLMAVRGLPPEEAERRAFAPRFGHLPILGTGHLHEPFREYAGWLREYRFAPAPDRFRTWLEGVYQSR
ncbi:MAG: protein-tyrosine phosphatase family protein [Isosphaeraceae bacterium]